MKVIIAGSRHIEPTEAFALVASAIESSGFHVSEIVSGCARGVDVAGESFAHVTGTPLRRFPAAWEAYGKAAGSIRNEQMARYADALIAIWDGSSRGTKHMIDTAEKMGLKVHVCKWAPKP